MTSTRPPTAPRPGETDDEEVTLRPTPAWRDQLMRLWNVGGGEFLTSLVALLVVVLAKTSLPAVVPVGIGLLLLGVMGAAEALNLTGRPTGAFRLARVVLLLAIATEATGPGSLVEWWAVALMGAVIAAEGLYSKLDTIAVPYAVNLPVLEIRAVRLFPSQVIFYVNCASVFLIGLLSLLGAPTMWDLVITMLALAVTLVGMGDSLLRIRHRQRVERRLPQVLTEYAPRFAVHWDAAAGTGYQIGRWLPYLDRLGERYIVVVRNPKSFPEASTMTSKPILLRRGATTLDPVMVASLRTVFYVNNALRNVHMVRYPGIRHIQLNHGDSDKAPSYNPVSRMFDKNFVAGQAAVDRFAAHGVPTGPDFFEIVGRPQVEGVHVVPGPIRSKAPRVLYAPTWAGMHSDSAYSSLPIGPGMVKALIQRGCVVIYRPHPYSDKSPALATASAEIRTLLEADTAATGTAHVLGAQAESQWTIVDCFNEADALISDVSSVVPDFLYSEKPFAICAMGGSVEEFFEEMPVAQAGYVVASDGSNIESVLDDLLGADPRLPVRTQLKTYYLGDIPAEGYAEAFLNAARRAIS